MSTTRRIRSISQCCIILTLTKDPFCLTLCSTVNTDLYFQQVGGRRSPGHVIGLWGSVSGVAMGTGAGGAVWLAARIRAPGVGGIVLGLHTHWHVGGPVDLLTGVVTVAGVPAAVEDGLLPTVCTLLRSKSSFSIIMKTNVYNFLFMSW